MKWGKVIEQNFVWEWRRHYISYKALKKIIKQLQQTADNDDRFLQLQFEFNVLVEKDLDDVESFYCEKQTEMQSEFDSIENEEKSNRLYQLEKFAYLNGEGFRKILKKYDKKLSQTASKIYLPLFKSKSFYYHTQIQQLHAQLSTNYEPIVCSYSHETQQKDLRGHNESVSLSMCHSDYRRFTDYRLLRQIQQPLDNARRLQQIFIRYFRVAHHPSIYIAHLCYILVLLLFIALFVSDVYFSMFYKVKHHSIEHINYLNQKIVLQENTFNAFMFPLFIFSLCCIIAFLVYYPSLSQHTPITRIKWILMMIASPVLITLLFGLSPIIIILLTILFIDHHASKSLHQTHKVSYEVMFMDQVNQYFYNTLLQENDELIRNNYYEFNFYALRLLFLSILHLYRIDDDDIKHMYLDIINQFIDYNDFAMEDDEDHNLHKKTLKCLRCLNDVFIADNKEFYFVHSNNDQQQSTWLSLLTSFQSYCILFFGAVCFHYILWWISFGWSSYALFDSFKQFSELLQFWAIRDGISSVLCAIYIWLRHKYMYYVMLYDYSWFHQDLRYLIMDNLIVNEKANSKNIARDLKFEKRFDSDDNDHCKFVMDHLMPILRHSAIKETLMEICFYQPWMANMIMTYSCDFGMYVVIPKCAERRSSSVLLIKN